MNESSMFISAARGRRQRQIQMTCSRAAQLKGSEPESDEANDETGNTSDDHV